MYQQISIIFWRIIFRIFYFLTFGCFLFHWSLYCFCVFLLIFYMFLIFLLILTIIIHLQVLFFFLVRINIEKDADCLQSNNNDSWNDLGLLFLTLVFFLESLV